MTGRAEERAGGSARGSSVPDQHASPAQRRPLCSLLDPSDALHLEGLGVRAPLPEVLVVARVVVTLQHVLKTSIARKLGADPAGKGKGADRYLSRGTSLATTAETQGAPRLRARSSPLGAPASNAPCSARHWNLFDHALPPASNTVPALLCLVELTFIVQVSARSSLQRGRSDIASKLGHGPSSDLCRYLRRCPPARSTSSPPLQSPASIHLRPRVDVEGAHFIAIPAHGLEGGVVITELSFPAQEVLLLEDGQPGVTVVLQAQGTESEHQGVSRQPRPAPAPQLSSPKISLPHQPSGRTRRKQALETLQETKPSRNLHKINKDNKPW